MSSIRIDFKEAHLILLGLIFITFGIPVMLGVAQSFDILQEPKDIAKENISKEIANWDNVQESTLIWVSESNSNSNLVYKVSTYKSTYIVEISRDGGYKYHRMEGNK